MAWLAAQKRQVCHEQARLHAGLVAVVDALDEPRFLQPPPDDRWSPLPEDVRDLAGDEVAAALAVTDVAAARQLDMAEACVRRLPMLHEAMLAGRVDYPKAKLFVDGTESLSEAKAQAVVNSLLGAAASRTTAQLRRALARRVVKADPDAAARRRDQALARREVSVFPDGDGTATLQGRGLPMVRARQAYGRITAIAAARKDAGDERLLDQIRSDVFLDLLQGLPVPGPDGQDAQPRLTPTGSVELTAPLTTLLGLAQEPGMYGSWGPILADAARDALAQLAKAPWRLTVTHPDTGIALATVPIRRRPTAEDLHYVRVRDRFCRIPHCGRPAIRCDIDHNQEWQDSGATHPCNLGPLCRKHHRRKTRRLWKLKQTGNGHFHLQSTLGRDYQVDPEPADDLWQPPDYLWDWTDNPDAFDHHDRPPPPEPHWAYAIDRPDEPQFRHDPDDYS